VRSQFHGCTAIGGLAQPQSSVLARNLNAEGPDARQLFNKVIGYFARTLYLIGIGMMIQNMLQEFQEVLACFAVA